MVSIKNKDFTTDSLSEAEVNTLEQIYDEFGEFDRWALVDWCHKNLEEWQDPKGSAIRIEYRDILMFGGKTEMEASIIEEELDESRYIDSMFGA